MSSPQSKSGVIYAGYFPPELMEQIKADPERYSATYAKLVGDFQKIVENSGDPNKSSNYSRHIGRNRPDVIPDPPPLQKEDMMEELASLRNKFANRLLLGHNVLMKYRHTVNSVEREYSTEPVSQLEPNTFYSFRLWGVTSKLIRFSCLRCLSRKGSWCVVITPSLCWS